MSLSVFGRRWAWSAESVMSGPSRLKPVAIRASRIAGERLVAGELLEDEAVERLVGVEGADDVVAIAPGVGPRFVELVAVGVGVAGEVEPVPAPALAVVRRLASSRSITFSQASGDVSLTNASISSGVGGRPIRSNVTRRMSVRRSASGANDSPFSCSFARTKRSIPFLASDL